MEKLSTSRDAAANKLLILYILSKLKMAATNIDITNYVLDGRLMEFMLLQQYLQELVEANHISCADSGGGNTYAITEDGARLVSGMKDMLPVTEKNRVDRTIKKLGRSVLDGRSVVARFTPVGENNGSVHMELNEGGISLLSMDVAVASREEARVICGNWRANTQGIYQGIVELLLTQPGTGATPSKKGAKARGRPKRKIEG